MKPSEDDALFLRSVPNGIIEEFRAEMYQESFIRKHPEKFVDTAWINVSDLKKFIQAQKESPPTCVERVSDTSISVKRVKRESQASPARVEDGLKLHKCVERVSDASISVKRVKRESQASPARVEDASKLPHKRIKREHSSSPEIVFLGKQNKSESGLDIGKAQHSMYRSVMEEGQEILELLSSDDEEAIDFPVRINDGMTSDTLIDLDSDSDVDFEGDPTELEGVSPSVWLDKDVSSTVKYGYVQITRERLVDCVEYVTGLPTHWPVPRDRRAFIIDLTDPKYDLKNKDGKLMTVDAIIKNSDQESWTGCSGGGINDTRPWVSVFGALKNQERYELHAESLDEVLKIQLDTRVQEANSPQKLALIFFAVCHSSPCTAKDSEGQICAGVPMLQAFKNNELINGHRHFVSCSGWSTRFREGHRTAYIPSGIRDEDLITLFNGEILAGFETPFPCGRIVPAHIGSKAQHCKFPHRGDGSQVKMVRHQCPASRTIFVPEDPTIRKACVIPNHEKPHTHPILPDTKTSKMIREMYKKCVEAAGIVGSSVHTVDNARTTEMLLGQAPSQYAPALQNNRVKQDIIRTIKKESYPYGTHFEGVFHVMNEDLTKPVEDRYIHGFAISPSGGRVILTANPYLLSRIHLARTLEVDTTFKRAIGKVNEWEAVAWDDEVQRALTLCRIYSDQADRDQYKTIFDELRRVTRVVTGKELKLKRLSKDGTLVSIGVDMELAQVLGAADSFLPTNDRGYSNIDAETPEELVPYFVRLCYTHTKRGIHDLQGSVTDEDYKRLINFMYLETKEEIDEFSNWIPTLKNPKVQAWWNHKVNNDWILPSLIKCLSKIDPDDWDRTLPTTNIGEAQHHWTNINTGVSLPLLEAIITARECDEKVAAEVKTALATGILKNHRNDAYTRMSRNTARRTHAHKKVQETREKNEALDAIDQEILSITATNKANAEILKGLKAKKRDIGSAKSGRLGGAAESSSSGKVKSKKFKPAVTKAASKSAMISMQENEAPPACPTPPPAQEPISTEHSLPLLDVTTTANLYGQQVSVDEVPPTMPTMPIPHTVNAGLLEKPPPVLSDVTTTANLYGQQVSIDEAPPTMPTMSIPHTVNAGLDLFALADKALAEGAASGVESDFSEFSLAAMGFGECGEQVDSMAIFDNFLARFGEDNMYA
ncbi:hypothetical protein BJ912DRAFT_1075466 [Pholiota molesta]|nr:hypothetical protein BJ912DRAFT_1075466 [Pholiota molesta]